MCLSETRNLDLEIDELTSTIVETFSTVSVGPSLCFLLRLFSYSVFSWDLPNVELR